MIGSCGSTGGSCSSSCSNSGSSTGGSTSSATMYTTSSMVFDDVMNAKMAQVEVMQEASQMQVLCFKSMEKGGLMFKAKPIFHEKYVLHQGNCGVYDSSSNSCSINLFNLVLNVVQYEYSLIMSFRAQCYNNQHFILSYTFFFKIL